MTTMMIIIVIRERSLVMLMKMLLGVVVLAVVVRMAVAVCEGSKKRNLVKQRRRLNLQTQKREEMIKRIRWKRRRVRIESSAKSRRILPANTKRAAAGWRSRGGDLRGGTVELKETGRKGDGDGRKR